MEDDQVAAMEESKTAEQQDVHACIARAHTAVLLRRKLVLNANEMSLLGDYATSESFYISDYVAVHTMPNDFRDPLRVRREGRNIKVQVLITMYNEHGEELERTLRAIAEQLDTMQSVSWQEMQVVVLVDGLDRMHNTTEAYASTDLRLFDRTLMEHPSAAARDVLMHVFERSIVLRKNTSTGQSYQPLQLAFAVKARNGGKLNSHMWGLQGFARQVKPEFIFFIDCGTEPQPKAFAKVLKEFYSSPNVGGVCGEIAIRGHSTLNFLHGSQRFEYAMSHHMDKAMESALGEITVLPGAFSAYRWEALQGKPLEAYFLTEEKPAKEVGAKKCNAYLAEDRVLAFEVLTMVRHGWRFAYAKGAKAHTDFPGALWELIKQRRRWLNGAFMWVLVQLEQGVSPIWRSSHTPWRKLLFTVHYVYKAISALLLFFSVSFLYLAYSYLVTLSFDSVNSGYTREASFGFLCLYVMLLILQVIAGMSSTPKEQKKFYVLSAFLYGLCQFAAVGATAWQLSAGNIPLVLRLASGYVLSCYALCALLHGDIIAIVFSFVPYLLTLPAFINILFVYSITNVNDVSWGTKEGNYLSEKARQSVVRGALSPEQKREREEQAHQLALKLKTEETATKNMFNNFRFTVVSAWLLSNFLLISIVKAFDLMTWYGYGLGAAMVFIVTMRTLGSLVFLFNRHRRAVRDWCCTKATTCSRWCCGTIARCCPKCCTTDDDGDANSDDDDAAWDLYVTFTAILMVVISRMHTLCPRCSEASTRTITQMRTEPPPQASV